MWKFAADGFVVDAMGMSFLYRFAPWRDHFAVVVLPAIILAIVTRYFFMLRDGDVDVFENLPRSDTKHAIGFDEVVALASGVLAAERIDEGEVGAELFGLDQEASAIGFPFDRFHWRADLDF